MSSIILVLLLSVLNAVYCFPTPTTQRTSSNKNQDAFQAVEFMKKFGYLEKGSTGNSDSLYSADAIETALKEVQLYGGIPQTGVLDNDTMELMTSPRCGVPERGNLLSKNRTKRFILYPAKWKKYHLTYHIANWSPQLSEESVRTSMRQAFNAWATYSQLKFTEVSHSNADIIILFASGHHGDTDPFDGRGNILAHAYMPGESLGLSGDIHFDEDELWINNPGPFDEGTDFFSVAVHELGHSLGLMHSSEHGSVMNPYYKQYNSESFRLGYDDILAVYDLYISNRNSIESSGPGVHRNDFDESTFPPTRTTTSTGGRSPHTVSPITTTSRSVINYHGDDESVDTHKKHDNRHGIPNTEEPPTFNTDDQDIDDICFGSFDAVSYFRNELFIFKNKQVWRLNAPGNIISGYPVTTERFFRTSGGPSEKISAVYERQSDSNIIIFSGKKYWIYDGNQFINGSPQPISNYGLPGYIDKIDAAMVWEPNKKTYLFSGDRYWRYDEQKQAMDEGYPRSMDNFRNVPVPLDAAMTWSDGVTYFFKGKDYWGFNNTWKKTDNGYPKSATSFWLGCKN